MDIALHAPSVAFENHRTEASVLTIENPAPDGLMKARPVF
jgi:hypothetical protein